MSNALLVYPETQECLCGCGVQIPVRDDRGRPHDYVRGHAGRNPQVTDTCVCGCGEHFVRSVTSTQRYKRWHQNKVMAKNNIRRPAWNKGTHWTPPNVQQFLEGGRAHRFRPGQLAGAKHHNWKGGITRQQTKLRNSERGVAWRKSVFERDNYTCVQCGKRGSDLVADHIKGFALHPELRFELSNGRTLCGDCNYQSTYVLKEWAKA